jgi:hypothetical protein|tara:strand:- start:125 stop:319 length:195 start_codon:yes stop_codon:yes gene_type:complete
MKTIKVWKAEHSMDDKGLRTKIRYFETEHLAKLAANSGWGYCGGRGSYGPVTLEIFENMEETNR